MLSIIQDGKLIQDKELTRPDVDNENHLRRSWLTDLRPMRRKFQPQLTIKTFPHALQMVSGCRVLLEAV